MVQGSIAGRVGNRRPPSAAYANNAPVFHHQIEDGGVLFMGGAFLDGRATGYELGSAIAAYESSDEVNRFPSRYDKWRVGTGTLSQRELSGLKLFKRALCAECHTTTSGPHG